MFQKCNRGMTLMNAVGRALVSLQRGGVCMLNVTKVVVGAGVWPQQHEGLSTRPTANNTALLHTSASLPLPYFGSDRLPRGRHTIPETRQQVCQQYSLLLLSVFVSLCFFHILPISDHFKSKCYEQVRL